MQCIVCQAKLRGHIKRHVLAAHLSWYTDQTTACLECERHVRDIYGHSSGTEREHTGIQNFSDLVCHFLFCLVFAMFCARLFICALWSPAGKGLTSWLSFVVSTVSLSLSH